MDMHVCLCVHLYIHVQQPEEDIENPVCHSPFYSFETGALTGPGARLSVREAQQSYVPTSTVLGVQVGTTTTTPSFYIAGD